MRIIKSERQLQIPFLLFGVLIVIAITCFFLLQRAEQTSVNETLSQAGGYIGGMIGTIIAGFALWYVYKTYKLQEKELKETRIYLQKQQFESTFFSMLNMIHNIGQSVETISTDSQGNRYELRGDDFFAHFRGEMMIEYQGSDPYFYDTLRNEITVPPNPWPQKSITSEGEIDRMKAWARDNEERFLSIFYKFRYQRTGRKTGHFFRYINDAIEFAITERASFGDAKRYIGLIQAQLSDYQLVVMFYHSLSSVSFNIEGKSLLRENIEKYNLLENMTIYNLIDHQHQKFYPYKLKG